jgi:hypothetical protein
MRHLRASLRLMPRFRAVLAILFAVTWCSAAWHAEFEALGMMLEHAHHATHAHHDDGDHETDHGPVGAHDDHADVVARDLAKDQVRVGAVSVLWLALLGVAASLVSLRPSHAGLKSARQRRETDPPLSHVWQFVQRCAPESAAPPALG